jgi:homoserine O-acetyltransferase
MSENLFTSSDTVRTARPLEHLQYADFDEPLTLESGQRLPRVRVAYETYGRLNAAGDNAVLICHALSGDSHAARHDAEDEPGWWDVVVGPGKAIDTDRYFVICPNILGGCRGTTGPNHLNPATGRPYGPDFPEVTMADMVTVQRMLLDRLGVETLAGVVGGSMGGMQVMIWARDYPDRVRAAIVVASAARLTSQGLAFDVIGRNAILHDPRYGDGFYYADRPGPDGLYAPAEPLTGLAIARMIGHITYLSREAMAEKFGPDRNQPRQVDSAFEKDTSVASYLAYQGDKFVERFDANSYVAISRAIDAFDFGEGEALAANLAPSRCRWLVVSFSSDWLFTPDQSRQIVDALVANDKPVSYCNVASACGHDAFLLPHEVDTYGGLLAAMLVRSNGHDVSDREPESDGEAVPGHSDTSIFRGRRVDYDQFERLLEEEIDPAATSVLDLGCGDGRLLQRLQRGRWRRLQGVEVHQRHVLAAVRRGVDCIHADLNDGLDRFRDKQFDCVLLSRTLQAVYNVDRVVDDMLRVGRTCIISFPNFAFEPLRRMLAEQGRAPCAPGLLRYNWYDTPNIRFLSIADFQDFCRRKGATVHRLVALNTDLGHEVNEEPNRNADLAIFVISRSGEGQAPPA